MRNGPCSMNPMDWAMTLLKVILPYTRRIQKVTFALDRTGYPYNPSDVTESQFKYYYLIKALWDTGESWINIEHDILPNPDTFQSFEDCPADWCIAPYPYLMMPQGAYAGLGCCKISARLIARHPDAMDIDLNWAGWDKNHRPRHWCRVDAMLKENLINNGERPHAHEFVQHMGDGWPSHGCVAKPKGAK